MINSSIIKLPGLVDVHVHLREPGATHKEDFESGTRAAVAGGYTQVLDMPNNTPPTTDPVAIADKIKLAKNRIRCDIGFNFGATRDAINSFGKISKEVFGLKVYMGKTTGPLLIEKDEDKQKIFEFWRSPLPIMVHVNGKQITEVIELAKKFKKRVHICHVTSDQIEFIRKAKEEGIKITCEVTPHHLFLNGNDLKKLGPFGMMKPPLTSNDPKILWSNLDVIDAIATDHAPHTKKEKAGKEPVFGVPGLETTLPLMLNAVFDGRLSFAKLIDMLATRPREIFQLPAQEETYILVDFSSSYNIGDKKLFTKCGWTPFSKLQGRGELKRVVLRGKKVFENGDFVGGPRGKIIKPQF